MEQSPTLPWKIMSVSSIAAGVQFAGALQISLLTPYIQTLGVPESFSALIWIYGAFSGMVLQPILGYRSDRCTSCFGRRRPFIAAGTALACLSFILISFAKDIGYLNGDSVDQRLKPRAVAVFVLGFWLFDVANNTLQGPCRALLADLCFLDHQAMRTAMSRERGSTERGVGEGTIQQQQQRDDVVHRASGVGVPQHEKANAVASGGDVSYLVGVVSVHSDGYELGGEGGVQREMASLAIGPLTRVMGGMKNVWGVANFLLAGGLIGAAVITKKAEEWWSIAPADSIFPLGIMSSTWVVYFVLGLSLAATYSIPFAMATIYCSIDGGGQGLSLGVLNLAIVFPQMISSMGSRPLNTLFSDSNAPSFVFGAVVATISAIISIFVLPDPLQQDTLRSTFKGR
ncbi:hypothetical protein EZV62_022323 [Acer yangbiense]|uniref:Major facilitator superfamily (MFS) profile domain-containing protein n=1 Tax=Acer yangbiense TaxID=1000413 RepID=A0A5C7H8B0_9ROSI|nr:hypothetical protein EZV62_022323 [Acer yangbiense]